MRSLKLLAFIALARAKDSEDELVDNLIDRVLKAPLQHADLDDSTLGKLAGQPASNALTRITPTQPLSAQKPLVDISWKAPKPGQRTETVRYCYQAKVLNAEMSVNAEAATKKKKGYKIVDGKEIPFNLFTRKEPLKAKVVKNVKYPQTITEDTGDANWETVHVTFDHGGKYPYIEGMSLGLISPGPDKTGKQPAAPRLYSIASSAVGDDESSKTVSLCVKRVVELDGKYSNRDVGEDKPDKAGTCFPKNKVYRGVASNYICDLNVGDEVEITGPVGTEMLLPEDPESVIIMLATGTGIAPMRSYLRLLFNDKAGAAPDGSRKFKGLAWLFLGVPYSKSLLYDDENVEYKKKFPGQYRYEYAISREQKNEAGQKMYIQTKLAQYAEELWDLLQYKKTHVYMCGLKGMESGIKEALGPIAEKNGQNWDELVKVWKKEDRYHVEVY